ncbi:uncharacterized protein FA14DRAFT_162639 [Meira miltonrushii]|uniref:SWIRM-domain-containing protein n=1 Tax=Meira miltonrushii TaxID=1280837 RepID=A0A316V8D1_9BASI|nr:uncharacterized protein FA14DRAFT_162639 [Meira miltonrushii]PWN31735.1 hypothetical protein FA14DRAFT_162639 [Meira miltonrushii]
MATQSLNLNGAPDESVFSDEVVQKRFESLVAPLKDAIQGQTLPLAEGKSELDAASLAHLTFVIQQFQHAHLENQASSSSSITAKPNRIPASFFLFADSLNAFDSPLSTSSAVYQLLRAALESIAALNRPSWSFLSSSSAEDVEQGLQLITQIRNKLKEANAIKHVRIAASGDLTGAEKDECREAAQKMDCQWVEDLDSATHVLFSSDASTTSNTTESQEFFRTLAKTTLSGGREVSLIHVWYRPDSYDTWLPARDFAEPDTEANARAQQRWTIGSQWLRDSVRFNEWMNEEDYERDEEESKDAAVATEQVPQSTSVNPRKRALPDEVTAEDESTANGGAGTGKKIKLLVAARPVGATAIDLSGASGPPPGRNYEKEPLSNPSMGNLPTEPEVPQITTTSTDDQTKALSGQAEEAEQPSQTEIEVSDEAARERERLKTEYVARKYLAEQTQEVIIPSYATWFSFSAINAVEKRSLPEFFNNRNRSKTPAIYKEYRNFMINTYRLNPSEYLTFTACRRNLAGDVCAIMRVHAFLEQWGLINYQIDPETRPATLGPPFTGHFRVTVDTPRGLQPLHPGTQRPSQPGVPHSITNGAVPSGTPGKPDLTLELRKTVYQTSLKLSRPIDEDQANALVASADQENVQNGQGNAYSCDTCGADCTKTRYKSIRLPQRGSHSNGFAVCASCYLEGRFPSNMYSGDFVRIDEGPFKQGGDQADWSDVETLRLLEGLEMYDDDWAQVSNHVGTRSREQCITKFLQLPIEDDYLNGTKAAHQSNGHVSNGAGQHTQGDLGPLQYLRDSKAAAVPFSQSDNPVMSVVAFLASAVSPAVAAAAAQSALGELTDGLRKRISKKSKEGESATEDAGKEGEKEKGDAMDVDAEQSADKEAGPDATTGKEASKTPEKTASASKDNSVIPKNDVERAASIAIGAAAAKAHVLATFEERECQKLVGQVLEAQMKKMEIKMAQFEQLESLIEEERRSLEISRKQLYADRLNVAKQIQMVQDLVRKAQANPKSVEPKEIQQVNSVQHGLSQQGPIVREANASQHPTAANGNVAAPAPQDGSNIANAPASSAEATIRQL